MEIQKVNRRLEDDFENISASPIMENSEFMRQRLAPPASRRSLPLQAGLQPNNLTPKAPLWQRPCFVIRFPPFVKQSVLLSWNVFVHEISLL